MVYVALLRGINVGGKRKVDMKQLKALFERAGMKHVTTYINSGNVIFQSDSLDIQQLADTLEEAIEAEFGFEVKVLLRDIQTMTAVMQALPKSWINDKTMKCDVIFLWENVDNPSVLERLTIKPEIDDVKYIDGALLWRVDRPDVTRSGMLKLIGTDLYKQMTIRNCNTARKIFDLMQQANV